MYGALESNVWNLHLLELLSKVSESHSTPIPQEQHLLEGFLREVDRRV